MTRRRVQLLVESASDERIVKAIFRQQVKDGLVTTEPCLTTSGVISLAELLLLRGPAQPVALILNTKTKDPHEVEELRGTVERILAGCSLRGWCLALAVPRLDAWAATDPRLQEALRSNGMNGKGYADQALRIFQLTKKHPFDPTNLRQVNPDFRGLEDFIRREAVGCEAGSSLST
jgi:hypothetical protein